MLIISVYGDQDDFSTGGYSSFNFPYHVSNVYFVLLCIHVTTVIGIIVNVQFLKALLTNKQWSSDVKSLTKQEQVKKKTICALPKQLSVNRHKYLGLG